MRIAKFVIASVMIALLVCALIAVAMFIYQSVLDVLMNDNAQSLTRRAKYNNMARIRGVHIQAGEEQAKGYGSIELLARYFELEIMPDKNKGSWSIREFRDELQRVFPDYDISLQSNLRNTELVDIIYDSLNAENPVIIFHAAETSESELEMRYSAVIAVDLANNRIILSDPQGTTVRYALDEFIKSTRFENFDMPLYRQLMFAFRIYAKNTIFIIDAGDHDFSEED